MIQFIVEIFIIIFLFLLAGVIMNAHGISRPELADKVDNFILLVPVVYTLWRLFVFVMWIISLIV